MPEDLREHPGTMDPEERDPKGLATVLVGAVSVILLAVIVILLQVLFFRTSEAERWRKVVSQQPEELRTVQNEHLDQISSYRWIDQQQGIVAIPIDRAKQLIVDEAQGDPAD